MTPTAQKTRPPAAPGAVRGVGGGRRRLHRLREYFVPTGSGPVPLRAPTPGASRGGSARRVLEGDSVGGRVARSLVADTTVPTFRDPDALDRMSVLERARAAVRVDVVAPATSEERADRLMLAVALTFVTVGACLILFVAYTFMFTGLQQQRQQHALVNEYLGPSASELFSYQHVPPEGQPAAVLVIPDIGLKQVVVEGTSAADTAKGPGLMIGTARPGTKGNAVIAGRRSTSGAPFAHILSLRPGDPITVISGLGTFHYAVEQVGTVTAGQTDPISPTHDARLTLVTSNAPVIPTGRDYVTAKLTSAPAHAPVPTAPAAADQRALAGDSSAVVPSVLWGLVFASALALTFAAYRRSPDNIWTVYLLSTPIVLALALEWFSNLYLLLPPTL